jgi:hypothetical protein
MTAFRHFPTLLLLATAVLASCGESGGKKGAADSASVAKDAGRADGATLERPSDVVRLALTFTVGDAFGYAITTLQDVSMTRDSNVEKSTQRMTYRYRFDVLARNGDGSARLRATCLAVTFKGDYDDGGTKKSMLYDSREKNTETKEKTFAQYNAPVGAPFDIVLSREGKVERVSNYDKVIARLLGKDFNTIKQQARQKIAEDYAENGLKNILQGAFQKLEDRPVGVDSAWHHAWAGTLGFLKVQNDATYTLKGFEKSARGKLAHIAATMTSKYVGSKTLDTGQGLATVETFDIKGTGTTLFNMDDGRPESRKTSQTVRVKFYVEPPEELKKMAPDQAKSFWWSQNATMESIVERIAL